MAEIIVVAGAESTPEECIGSVCRVDMACRGCTATRLAIGLGSGVGFGVSPGVGLGVGSGVGFGVSSGVGFGVGLDIASVKKRFELIA